MSTFRLPRRPRKVMLTLHVISSGAWIGIDVVFAVLVVSALLSDDRTVDGIAYEAIARFLAAPMLAMGVVSLLTGLILGLGTTYGLVRTWWVTVKLVINVVLVALVLGLLMPGMGELRDHGELLLAGVDPAQDLSELVMPPLVSLTALTLATVLSIFKPWGRTPWSKSPDRKARFAPETSSARAH